ncbi:unnamed protein product, partial [Allacma fusca]
TLFNLPFIGEKLDCKLKGFHRIFQLGQYYTLGEILAVIMPLVSSFVVVSRILYTVSCVPVD